MHKKKDSKIIFTNDEYIERPKRGNRVKSKEVAAPRPKIRSFDFKYTFNEYVKLSLCRIIPSFASKVTFIPSKNIIIGPEQPCHQLIARAAEQLQTHRYTPVKNLTEGQLDCLDYELQDGMRLYRPGVVKIALSHLDTWDCFKKYIENMNEQLGHNVSMMRFERSLSEKAYLIKSNATKTDSPEASRLEEEAQTEGSSNKSQGVENSIDNSSQLSITMLEQEVEEDEDKVEVPSKAHKYSALNTSKTSLTSQPKQNLQTPVEQDPYESSMTMNSIEDISDETINITEADHTASHHIYRSKQDKSPQQPAFVLAQIDLDAPL